MNSTKNQPAVTLRTATMEDLDALVDLIIETNIERYERHAPWDEAAFRDGVREQSIAEIEGRLSHSTTYVVESQGKQVGRLRLVRTDDSVQIGGIQIVPFAQGRGLGTALIESVIHEATQRGLPVVLDVEKDNPHAERLYRRLGFAPFDEDDERRWMERPLSKE